MSKEEIEKEISEGISIPRSTDVAKIIFHELHDEKWAAKLIEETFDRPQADEGVDALKFLLNELKQEAIIKKLIKDNTDYLYSIFEHSVFADFISNDLKDKDWAIELIERGIANITTNNSEECDVCNEYGVAAVYVKNNFKDDQWSNDLLNVAIKKIRTNFAATQILDNYKQELNAQQISLLEKMSVELPESVDNYDPNEGDIPPETPSNTLLIEVQVKGYELNDFEALNDDLLGMMDIKLAVEEIFPDNEINYFFYSATEESIEEEGECIHFLWCIINIKDLDPNDIIPNNQDAFLALSSDLQTRICCYIVPDSFVSEFDCVPPNFEKFYAAANEKYMSYLEGDFDSGFYM
jgi:hypothetical protein